MAAEPISRDRAVEILLQACEQAALADYADKFTENEEDLRACIYHHVRAALDHDKRWRVFLSYSTRHPLKESVPAALRTVMRKPDLVFLRGETVHTNVSLEILVELKNWPSREQIESDLNKLKELAGRFHERPVMVFFGIGRSFTDKLKTELRQKFPEGDGFRILLYDHDAIYRGPWEHGTDPYRKKLRLIDMISATVETS